MDPVEFLTTLGSPSAWMSLLTGVALKGTFVLLATIVALFALRRKSADIRHLTCALAVGALLLLPLFSATVESWRVPVPWQHGTTETPVDGRAVDSQESTAPLSETPAFRRRIEESRQRVIERDAARSTRIAAIGALIWLTGALSLFGSLLVALTRVRRLTTGTLPFASEYVPSATRAIATELRIRRPISVVQGGASTSPMTWGVLRPVVTLPSSAAAWDPGRLRRVLLHELTHVRRNDWIVHIASSVVVAFYWFHPLAWLVVRRMRFECEVACDDAVVRAGELPSTYASDLIEIVRDLRTDRSAALVGVGAAHSTPLQSRLQALLNEHVRGAALKRGTIAVWVSAVMIVVFGVATARTATLTGLENAAEVSPCWELVPGTRISHMRRDSAVIHIGFSRPGCSAEIRLQGRVTFTNNFSGIQAVAPDARILIAEKRSGIRRQLEVLPDSNGQPLFDWRVGRTRPAFDAESQRWLARELLVLFRTGGYAAPERADWIFASGGVDGILREIPMLRWTQRQYEDRLIERLEPDRTALVDLMRTGQEFLSDDALSDILVKIATMSDMPLEPDLHNDYLRATKSIHSRNALARALNALLNTVR